LRLCDLYTLRVGEIAYHNPTDTLITLDQELIKIKEREGSKACMFLDHTGKSCSIYENRPLQCRTLKCWDTSELEKALALPKLTRLTVLPSDLPLRAVIEAHEDHCSLRRLRALLRDRAAEHGGASNLELQKMVHYDELLRVKIVEQFQIPFDRLDFLFGRPLKTLIDCFI